MSQSDVAVLVIPANRYGFEPSTQRISTRNFTEEGQTIAHAELCHNLGIINN